MKYVFILLISCWSIKAQDCQGFFNGTFIMKYKYGEVIIERSGDWQLEKVEEYGDISLSKIEKVADCEYLLRSHEVIKSGKLPEPTKEEQYLTKITYIEGNKYYFKSSKVGTEMTLEGVFIKKSDEISDEFKKLIAEEGKSLD